MSYKKNPRQESDKNNIRPNKLLGQHFLHDKNVLAKIIGAANLTRNDTILEVGPGLGILTRELAKYAGQVIAVEKDRALAEILTKKLADEQIDNVKIIADDVLKFLKTKNYQPSAGYKVVANIPYYLTSHLIRLLLELSNPPQDIILLIQKEVAKRICACPPKLEERRGAKPLHLRQGSGGQARMSLLAISVQFYAEAKIIASVSRKSFRPEPKVDSAIIRITPKILPPLQRGIEGDLKNTGKILPNPPFTKEGIANFFTLLHAGFSHPRKQLLGNLSQGLKIEKERIGAALAKVGIKNSQRAETLTVENWLELSKNLNL